ncbi:MAG: isocitrate lyase/PEP mutase family protein [Desulfobacterales bacterium]|nr:MAG: isocitrate lyase/PEP mutase family protein [Desulfobacterales bacterium]
MKKSEKLRELLSRPQILILPGAYDALSARIIEMSGFKALIHSGYGTAASLLAQPDIGLVNFREMCDRVRYIARSVEIPTFADGDTGYGNAINVFRTVKEYIWAGAAGMFIEDQIWPKKCGHMFGKETISKHEFVVKIKAASDARNEEDPDFVLMARTDALAVNGLDDAIERVNLCREAGADLAFIEAYENVDQIKKAIKDSQAPLALNLIEGGKTPLFSVREAESMGFKIVFFGLTALYAAAKGMMDVLKLLKAEESAQPYLDRLITFPQFEEIVHSEKLKHLVDSYLSAESLEE